VLTLRNLSGEVEEIRTDRGDTDAGRAMIARARSLTGRRVLVYKQVESMASDPKRKVRIAAHVMDLGPDTAAAAVHEDEAKQMVLRAVGGDEDTARRAWRQVGLPERGPVTAQDLAAVLGSLAPPGGPEG
jgi:hypothetical protein